MVRIIYKTVINFEVTTIHSIGVGLLNKANANFSKISVTSSNSTIKSLMDCRYKIDGITD